MKTYLETSEFVTKAELDIFWKIKVAVNALPDSFDFGRDQNGRKVILSCHILARAVSRVSGLSCVDGFYYPTFSHSWLVTKGGNVIDVYPVGMIGGPILVHRHERINSPGKKLYEKRSIAGEEDFDFKWFKDAVNTVAELLQTPSRA